MTAIFRELARRFLHGSSLPFFQSHSRETTEWVTLVQDQSAKPCAIEKRTNYGGLPFEDPPESASPTVTLTPVRVSGRLHGSCFPVSPACLSGLFVRLN